MSVAKSKEKVSEETVLSQSVSFVVTMAMLTAKREKEQFNLSINSNIQKSFSDMKRPPSWVYYVLSL